MIFERKLGDKLVKLIIIQSDNTPRLDRFNGQETEDFTGLCFDGVLTNLGFDNTYDLPTALKMLERRTLYSKMLRGNKPLEKVESDRLAELTTELSDYSENYADGLFYEFVNALREVDKLEQYLPNMQLTQAQKNNRRKEAVEIIANLKARREASSLIS